MPRNVDTTPEGLHVLPTSTKYHCSDRPRSTGYCNNQYTYVLEATDEDGYPPMVILTSNVDLDLDIDDIVKTQHATAKKNLPERRVMGIVFPDGITDGEMPDEGMGIPHWEFVPTGKAGSVEDATVKAIYKRVEDRRKEMKRLKEAGRGRAA
jgi:hypothetical protein